MNWKKEFPVFERITLSLCALIGIAYLLGYVKVIDIKTRQNVVYWLVLGMLITNAIAYRKKSKMVFVFCIIGAVVVAFVAIASLYLFLAK
ncbi:MAG: hypothetical protein PUC65_13445 [Clostridiales bacterium]|nr:hypothetical protein [Clostridiales bacterium]